MGPGTILQEEPQKDGHLRRQQTCQKKQQWNNELRFKEATIPEEGEDIWQDLQKDHRAGDRKANSRTSTRLWKNECQDIVEGSAPTKQKKRCTQSKSQI
jgi:hypothetical protein